MKRIIKVISLIIIIILGSKYINIEQDYYNFVGNWKIVNLIFGNNEIETYESKYINISKNYAIIFGEYIEDIKYKLKVVDENYVLSYENNLTIKDLIDINNEVDVISIIFEDKIIAEFIITSMNEMIFSYRSEIYKLIRTYDKDEKVIINKEYYNNEEFLDEGVMLGLKNARFLNENGSYSKEEYRTLWITYKDGEIGTVYEKENIIFPRMNGIWNLEVDEIESNKHYDKLVCKMINDSKNEITKLEPINESTYKTITFVGNDYIGIESYTGENFNNIYSSYKIIPVDNINIEKGLSIEEIFDKKTKEKYTKEYNESVNKLKDEEISIIGLENINYSDITMKRVLGRWRIVGKINTTKNDNQENEFVFSILPNKKLINFNSLYVPWKTLKGELVFFKDAFTSPEAQIIIVQFNNFLSVYRINNGINEESPLINIPILPDEEIIMTEWCGSTYVDQWEKNFIDGRIIE